MSTQLRGYLYILSYVLGALLLLLITVLRRKAYHTGLPRAVIYGLITFFSGLCGAMLAGLLYDLIAFIKGVTAVMSVDVLGAVIFTMPLLLAVFYIEKALLKRLERKAAQAGQTFQPWHISFRDTTDLLIPGAFIVLACIKAGCAFRGCCFGIECSWGVTAQFYYHKTVFPVQIFESASLFAIAVASHYIQKASFYRRGLAAPFGAFLYGIARFFWEFFRYNPPELRHFFIGLTIWQLFCILVLIITGVWCYVLIKTQPREPRIKVKLFTSKVKDQKAKKDKSSATIKEWIPHLTQPKKKKIAHNKKQNRKKR